ncbi:hypothetical protein QR98_0067830 [Sarcoptes scabiei]|uniref:Uncharacterized protein n=1 Tax=Sarcoptes scabiei TaxID=52283 RepID=A0A132ABH4_SARSC|nr:hypothetical protein QR98_0067830 [Sarcoptes scabiei]
MLIEPPPTICVQDYWPQKITVEDLVAAKKNRKYSEIRRKLKKTLSIDTSNSSNNPLPTTSGNCSTTIPNNPSQLSDGIAENGDRVKSNPATMSSSIAHGEMKECLEKIPEIIDRINKDIIERKIDGRILNVVTFPCYHNRENDQISDIKIGKIPHGHIVNIIRIFYLAKSKPLYEEFEDEYENEIIIDDFDEERNQIIERKGRNETNQITTAARRTKKLPIREPRLDQFLVGFMDFIPKCISGGGFIKYPRFETQTDLIDKATLWLNKNPNLIFLNFSSVDIKLKSISSIDSGEMTFTRNSGDFIRILRLCYLKPYTPQRVKQPQLTSATGSSPSKAMASSSNHHSGDFRSLNEDLQTDKVSSMIRDIDNQNSNNGIESIVAWQPSIPIYLQCKNIVSINNSIKELQQQMNDYLIKVRKNESSFNRENWKFLSTDSIAIFISSVGGSDSKNRRNNLVAECDKSFHSISISSTNMNRNMWNVINVFYCIGVFGQHTIAKTTTSAEAVTRSTKKNRSNQNDIFSELNDKEQSDLNNNQRKDPMKSTNNDNHSNCSII